MPPAPANEGPPLSAELEGVDWWAVTDSNRGLPACKAHELFCLKRMQCQQNQLLTLNQRSHGRDQKGCTSGWKSMDGSARMAHLWHTFSRQHATRTNSYCEEGPRSTTSYKAAEKLDLLNFGKFAFSSPLSRRKRFGQAPNPSSQILATLRLTAGCLNREHVCIQ